MTLERSSISSSEANSRSPKLVDGIRIRKFPVAALAALALVAAFEVGFVWHYRYHFWDANYILLEQKRKVLTGDTPSDDVAILGSSRFYHVRPKPIADLLGENARVTNYAWGYCGVEAYEAMLRGLIKAGRTPKIVVVDGIPELFGYSTNLLSISELDWMRVGFTMTVPFEAGMRTEVGQHAWNTSWGILTYCMTPPSTLYRTRLWSGLQSLTETGKLPGLPPEYDRLVGNWERRGWFYFVPPDHVANLEEFKQFEKNTGPYKLRNNNAIAYSYERFVRLAGENNVRVIMLPVPNNSLVYDVFERDGIYAKYNSWLDRLERKYKNFSAPEPRWVNWPNLLGDAIHVNAAGAKKHMNLILEMLRSSLPTD